MSEREVEYQHQSKLTRIPEHEAGHSPVEDPAPVQAPEKETMVPGAEHTTDDNMPVRNPSDTDNTLPTGVRNAGWDRSHRTEIDDDDFLEQFEKKVTEMAEGFAVARQEFSKFLKQRKSERRKLRTELGRKEFNLRDQRGDFVGLGWPKHEDGRPQK